jgi:hypothetical protein
MRIIAAISLMLAALHAPAAESFQGTVPVHGATHPALYSFADVYRLAVAGRLPALTQPDSAEAPIRVASTQPAPAPELQFFVAATAERERWSLLLAGVAAALWVARRRLGYL